MEKKSVKEMSAYSAPMEGRANFKRFDFNEATINPSEKVKNALRNFIDSDKLNVYPHDYPTLQRKIAEYVNINEECVRITDGADGAIEAVALTYIEKDDEVIVPSPSFGMFFVPTAIEGAKIIMPQYDNNMEFPTEEILDKINEKTKLIIICNPNNPTGTITKREDIIKILDYAKNSIIMIDEVYGEFSKQSVVDLIPKYKNLIVIKSFSKAFSLASARVGYLISNPENIQRICKVTAPYNVNQFGVVAAIAALDDISYMKNYVDEVMNKSKPLLESYLNEKKIKFYLSSANFLLIEVGNSTKIYELFKEREYLIRPQRGVLSSCIRVSIGTLKDTEEFIKILDKVFRENNGFANKE
jgi:histidinol-phosphate aminotransferase